MSNENNKISTFDILTLEMSYIEDKLNKKVCNQKLLKEIYHLRHQVEDVCNFHIRELRKKMKKKIIKKLKEETNGRRIIKT